jgi:hypothetical protein
LAPKALLDDEKWLERVETFLTEMTGASAKVSKVTGQPWTEGQS